MILDMFQRGTRDTTKTVS